MLHWCSDNSLKKFKFLILQECLKVWTIAVVNPLILQLKYIVIERGALRNKVLDIHD
jgi:hypothetical protein